MKKEHIIGALAILVISAALAGYLLLYKDSGATRADYTEPLLLRVERSNEAAKGWLFNNVREKGLFVYTYNPVTGEEPDKNNAIRQLMASRILADESTRNKELRELHQRNLDFLFEFWYRTEEEKWGYVYYDNKSKLGANAMLVRTLVASPYFKKYEVEAGQLAEGILKLQNSDGSFEPWYIEPEYEYNKAYLLTFYSGEALLALVEYYEKTGDTKYLDAARLSAEFYILAYADNIEYNYYPAYVPWHTMALNKLHRITSDEQYINAIFVMNDKLLELLDRDEYVGRFYNEETPQYGSPHASSDGVYTEGVAHALDAAKRAGDEEHIELYSEVLRLSVSNLMRLQYSEYAFPSYIPSENYVGAIKVRIDSRWIRVDTTQHTIDAFTKVLEVLN